MWSNAAKASCRASVLVQNVLAQVQSFHSSFGWIVGPSGTLLTVAFHGLPTHKFKNSKSQALSPSRRLTQRVFIAPVGVNNRSSSVRSSLPTKTSRPPHSQFGPIFGTVSSQADLREWNNFANSVLASKTEIWRSPRSFHLKMIHNPCTVPNHPTHQHMIRSVFCFVF